MEQEARVLVIEDSSSTRQIICDYLESQGVHTDSAANGQEGIEAFRRLHPDIVLVDLMMPEVDGIEVVGVITVESPDTGVIVVSGVEDTKKVAEAFYMGAWDYVSKSGDLLVFKYAVKRALEKAQLRRESHQQQTRAREMERQFIVMVNQAFEPLCLADPQTGKIVRVNPAAAELWGKPAEEIVGEPLARIFPPQRAEFLTAKFRTFGECPVTEDEIAFATPTGEKRLQVRGTIVAMEGKPILQVAVRPR